MALPTSRTTTFIAQVTTIGAAIMNAIQDMLVAWWGSQYHILTPAIAHRSNAAHWPTNSAVALQSGAASEFLIVPLEIDAASATVYQKITEVKVFVDPGGASVMSFELLKTTDMTAGAPTTSSLGTASSSGANYQVVTFSGLNIGQAESRYIYLLVTSAQASDLYYGTRVKYDRSLYV